jgi:flagellar biosynthetic protein FliQ
MHRAVSVESKIQNQKSKMAPQDAVDLTREAIMVALVIGAPVLVAGLLVGLVVGLLQALTQVQEQTVAFVPKLVAMVLVLSFTLPWLIARLVDYTHDLIENIPLTL